MFKIKNIIIKKCKGDLDVSKVTNNKHAYLIMLHNNFNQAKRLLRTLDDERNDIYIHIDGKVKDKDKIENYLCKDINNSKIYITDSVCVNWGGYSQIRAEIILLEYAVKGKYAYYHLLSGSDFPLKTQDEIHRFFIENQGKEFVHFATKQHALNSLDRYKYYYFFQDKIVRYNSITSKFLKKIQSVLVKIEKLSHVDRCKNNEIILKRYGTGANWFSITHGCANYVLTKKAWIEKTFCYGLCVDECFLQTIILNSPYYENCYHKKFDDDYKAIMREIDWDSGSPYTFCREDYDQLIASEYLFARKVDDGLAEILEHNL